MNREWSNQGVRGSRTPADGLVGVLYGLPQQQVGTWRKLRSVAEVTTVGDALDAVKKVSEELVAPVHQPESLRRAPEVPGIEYATRRSRGGETFVLPGRPFPRFPFIPQGR